MTEAYCVADSLLRHSHKIASQVAWQRAQVEVGGGREGGLGRWWRMSFELRDMRRLYSIKLSMLNAPIANC